jgi:hypothetical protein
MFFLLFFHVDRRIRIRIHTSDWWIRIREAQKTCGSGSGFTTLLSTSNIYLNIDCRMSEAEFASGQKRAQLVQKLAGTVPVLGAEGQG